MAAFWDVIQTWDITDYDKAVGKLNEYSCGFTRLPDGRYLVKEYALFTYKEENGELLHGHDLKLAGVN